MAERTKVMTLDQCLRNGTAELNRHNIANAAQEARKLAQHALGMSVEQIVVFGNQPVDGRRFENFQEFVQRRCQNEPLARIVGGREFYGRWFFMGPQTLEPRDDTGALIDAVLHDYKDRNQTHQNKAQTTSSALAVSSIQDLTFLDLGTGSGIIAISLALELEGCQGLATDISVYALNIAEKNARNLGAASRLDFVQSDWCQSIEGRFDIIVSNPPYIQSNHIVQLAPEVVGHDPKRALDGGLDGLECYRMIVKCTRNRIKPDGRLYLEVGMGQAKALCALGERCGWNVLRIAHDMHGVERVVVFTPKP